jgi:hypothetical protein
VSDCIVGLRERHREQRHAIAIESSELVRDVCAARLIPEVLDGGPAIEGEREDDHDVGTP